MADTPPPPKYVVCRVTGTEGLAEFIAKLIAARHASKETGGLYSAFLHLADGQVLQLEIGLPTERKA